MMAPGAVLTADISDSTSPGKNGLIEIAGRLETILKRADKNTFSFYRGDSFQCYLKKQAQALQIAFQLRTEVLWRKDQTDGSHTDLKVSIGIARKGLPFFPIGFGKESWIRFQTKPQHQVPDLPRKHIPGDCD